MNEVQLIEQVVLEPEHELVTGGGSRNRRIPGHEGRMHIVVAHVGCHLRYVPRAHGAQPALVERSRHGAVVERVGPDRGVARNRSARDQVGRGGAVGEVEEAGAGFGQHGTFAGRGAYQPMNISFDAVLKHTGVR